MKESIKIVEVGPRDGLQNESRIFSVEERIELIRDLKNAGLKWMEGGSFVSPKAIPQMAGSEDVWSNFINDEIDLSFLVANEKGLERALAAQVRSIAVFTATSESFNEKNIRRSVEDSLELFKTLVKEAKSQQMRVRGYVSTVFGCPYEGFQEPARALKVVRSLFDMGCDEVSVGDTIGVALPAQVETVFKLLSRECPISKLAAHMHDTRGTALANILSALNQGVRIFDASVGGLGGCPYAQGSSGNVATEEVVYLLEGIGFETGISLEELLKVGESLEKKLERRLQSKLYLAKPRQFFFQ